MVTHDNVTATPSSIWSTCLSKGTAALLSGLSSNTPPEPRAPLDYWFGHPLPYLAWTRYSTLRYLSSFVPCSWSTVYPCPGQWAPNARTWSDILFPGAWAGKRNILEMDLRTQLLGDISMKSVNYFEESNRMSRYQAHTSEWGSQFRETLLALAAYWKCTSEVTHFLYLNSPNETSHPWAMFFSTTCIMSFQSFGSCSATRRLVQMQGTGLELLFCQAASEGNMCLL